MIRFFAHFLFILAAWTLVIKYVFPIAYALQYGLPAWTFINLDLWPVVHVWLGWSLVIIVSKFAIFLSAPEWTIWRTNWFVNKIFVLSCFVMLLTWLLVNVKRLPRGLRRGSPESLSNT